MSADAMTETLERKAAYRKGAGSRAQLVGIQGLAALLDASPDTARRYTKETGFPAPVDLPGDARWRVSDVEAWLDGLA